MSSLANMSPGSKPPIDLKDLATPLSEDQLLRLQQIAAELSPQQLAWVSGYLWGLNQTPSDNHSTLADSGLVREKITPAEQSLTIVFASQTGNAKGIAEALAQQAKSFGLVVELFDASDFNVKRLKKLTYLIIVASTNGEGEAPDNAIELHEFLGSKKAPKLPNLNYAVIALGDSSYEYYCQTGKDFDRYLSQLGAKPFVERVDCDIDYDDAVEVWSKRALELIHDKLSGNEAEVVTLPLSSGVSHAPTYNKRRPFSAVLLTNQKITGRDSTKDVRHIEIDLEGSGIAYQPGDSLGVWFQNRAELVNEILAKVGLSGVESVDVSGESLSIHSALLDKYEITASNPKFITQFAQHSGSKKLQNLLKDKIKLRNYVAKTQIADVLAEKKTTLSADELCAMLRRLTPRLYSISSSQAEVEEEVHLTVSLVEYAHRQQLRVGGASGYVCQQLEEGQHVSIFVESNSHFKLPSNNEVPIIMVGPGTGIAPFRSFLQERDQSGSTGKNWLIFGDRTFTQDFLYQSEWLKYKKQGLLTRLDIAFSRDQPEKQYVQHCLLEQAEEVWSWIEQGAYFYVCGDATHMAKDVHQALLEICSSQGGLSMEKSEQYLIELKKTGRYQKDVY